MDLDLTLPPSLPTAQAHREEGTGARPLGFPKHEPPRHGQQDFCLLGGCAVEKPGLLPISDALIQAGL